ncbi:MAG: cell division protein SepF [Thermoplasmata archaeon]
MSFIKKPFKKFKEAAVKETDQYIDLGDMTFEDIPTTLGTGVKGMVKVAEVYRYEDINQLTSHVYNGNILIVDYGSIANDELALKRITNELKSVARDTGGDVAGIGKNLLIATPGGIKVDRQKVRGSY